MIHRPHCEPLMSRGASVENLQQLVYFTETCIRVAGIMFIGEDIAVVIFGALSNTNNISSPPLRWKSIGGKIA